MASTDDILAAAGVGQPQSAASTNDILSAAGIASPAVAQSVSQPVVNPAAAPVSGGVIRDLIGASAHNFVKPIHGLAQSVERGIDFGLQKLPSNPVSDYWHGVVAQDDAAIKDWEDRYQSQFANNPASFTGAAIGGTVPFLIGGVPNLLRSIGNPVAGLVSKVAPNAPRVAQALGGAAEGAVSSAATTPVTDGSGDYWGAKAKQMEIGAGLGLVAPTVLRGVSSVLSPVVDPAVRTLRNAGVDLTIGQRLGGMLNSIEEKSQSIPFVGDFISKARANAVGSYNLATLNDVVSPVGGKVTQIGHDGVKQAGDILTMAYNNAKANIGNFALDSQAKTDWSNLKSLAAGMPPNEAKRFASEISDVEKQIAPNGGMMADTWKTLDSKLGQLASQFSGSTDAYQQQLGSAFKEAQSILAGAAKRSNPTAGAQMDAADAGWARLVRVEQAARAASGAQQGGSGVFSPAQLMAAVRGADDSVRGRATARGDALLQDWAQAGIKTLGSKIPNSGTFDRTANAAALAYLAGNPQYLVPAAAGTAGAAIAYSRPGQKALVSLAADRPQAAKSLAQLLMSIVPTVPK